MNKLKFKVLLKIKIKNKNNNTSTVKIFYNLQNHPTFHSEERLVNLAKRSECLVGLSLLLVYSMAPVTGEVQLEPCHRTSRHTSGMAYTQLQNQLKL